MSTSRWFLPRADIPPPPSGGGGSGLSFVPSGRPAGQLGLTSSSITGGLDRLIDPATFDYVRLDNGDWAETADSRTIVLIAMSIELGASPYNPSQGTTIRAQQRAGFSLRPDYLQAETLRVFAALAGEGILSDYVVQAKDADGLPLRDSEGRQAVMTQWRDLASGSPVTQTFSL